MSENGSATYHPPTPQKDIVKLLAKYGNDLSNLILDEYDFSTLNLRGFKFVNSSLIRCQFINCDLSYVDFRGSNLYRADLSGSILYVSNFRNADLTRVKFRDCRIYGAKLHAVDLTRAEFDDKIPEERMATAPEDYIRAAEIYYKLKRAHRENGLTEIAARFYVKERTCLRHALKKTNKVRWLFDFAFGYALSNYGESIVRVLCWAIVLLVVTTVLYTLTPTFAGDSYISVAGNPIKIGDSQSNTSIVKSLTTSLYFSLNNLIGITPSEYTAVGWMKLISSVESILGIFLTAVAVAVYLRKLIRD